MKIESSANCGAFFFCEIFKIVQLDFFVNLFKIILHYECNFNYKIYNILKGKLGKNKAKSLTEYVKSKVERTFEKEKDVLANLANAKSDIVKWIFIFWIGQIAATLGIVKIFIF